jgi:hypothetical protein
MPKSPTSKSCCLGVKSKCPPGKVCPSLKRDKNRIQAYIKENKLNDEQRREYIRSIYKSAKKKSGKKKSAKKSRKSASKKRKSIKKKSKARK